MTKISLSDYQDLLESHDWFYAYSDDHRVWIKGQNELDRLIQAAKQSPEHQKLLDEFRASKFK